jgi:tetratricopeptide (TPR) repeat protein
MKAHSVALLGALAIGLAACASAPKAPALDNEKNPQYQYDKAVISMNYGLPEEALRYLDQTLALDPRFAKAHRLKGIIRLQNKEPALAAEAFARWLEVDPGSSEGHLYLGTACQEMGESDRAEAEFRASFEVDGNAPAAFRLGRLLLGKGDLAKALEYADHAIEKAGKESDGYNLKGVILNQMGRYPEAVASFQAALALAPNDPSLMVNLGIAFINSGAHDKARTLFEKALPLLKDPALRDRVQNYLKMIDGRKT